MGAVRELYGRMSVKLAYFNDSETLMQYEYYKSRMRIVGQNFLRCVYGLRKIDRVRKNIDIIFVASGAEKSLDERVESVLKWLEHAVRMNVVWRVFNCGRGQQDSQANIRFSMVYGNWRQWLRICECRFAGNTAGQGDEANLQWILPRKVAPGTCMSVVDESGRVASHAIFFLTVLIVPFFLRIGERLSDWFSLNVKGFYQQYVKFQRGIYKTPNKYKKTKKNTLW